MGAAKGAGINDRRKKYSPQTVCSRFCIIHGRKGILGEMEVQNGFREEEDEGRV